MPTANYDSSYRFTTCEQLRQDIKNALCARNQTVSDLCREIGVSQANASRFLAGHTENPGSTLSKYCIWLSSALSPAQPSTPLTAWLTLQSCLLTVAGRTGGLPPDALNAIATLNTYFAHAAQESNHD